MAARLPEAVRREVFAMLGASVAGEREATATDAAAAASASSRPADEPHDEREGEAVIRPHELDALLLPGSCGLFFRDGAVGRDAAERARAEVLRRDEEGMLRPAGMSASANVWRMSEARGDRIGWLSEAEKGDACAPFAPILAFASCLRSQLARAAPELALVPKISVQLTHYPGTATARRRYVRHLDAHMPERGGAARSQCRRITLLWYLNPGWLPEWGGQLRAYPQSRHAPRCGMDVEPLLDRVLVFRSDLVEHEVLPTSASRCAVTVWLYGSGAPGVPQLPQQAPVPRPLPTAPEQDRIFVSIASYRDPGLGRSVAAALAAAADPQRVVIGAYVQASLPRDERCVPDVAVAETAREVGATLRLRVEPAHEAAGPVVARARARSLLRDEPFVLQVDAHTRFAPGWDRLLLAQLRACSSPRAVLTAYPTDFERDSPTSDPVLEFPRDAGATLLLPDRFDDDGMLRWRGKRLLARAAPVESRGWAAGFHFGPSAAFRHLPYVESLRWLFFGEEALATACLWTRGWDFFAPSEPVLVHAWSRQGRPTCWELASDATKAEARDSRERVRAVLGGEPDPEGELTLGDERALLDLERFLQVSFRDRVVRSRGTDPKEVL